MIDTTLAPTISVTPRRSRAADLSRVGHYVTLYGLVLMFGWIGLMKFTAYEVAAIEGLVLSSPLLSWLYLVFAQQGAANLIGIIEVMAAVALALRPWSALAGAAGAGLMAAITAVTLSFLLTAPAWEASLGGFPALSVVPGPFLVKDAVLFGAALWLLGDALRDVATGR
jgi:uncharacterized membrane protein YkgB